MERNRLRRAVEELEELARREREVRERIASLLSVSAALESKIEVKKITLHTSPNSPHLSHNTIFSLSLTRLKTHSLIGFKPLTGPLTLFPSKSDRSFRKSDC